MVTLEMIAELAAQQGIDNASRDEFNGVLITSEESATRMALESFFDGAEDLNTPKGRTTINLAYRMGYTGHWS